MTDLYLNENRLLKWILWSFTESEIRHNALNTTKSKQMTKTYFLGHSEYVCTICPCEVTGCRGTEENEDGDGAVIE